MLKNIKLKNINIEDIIQDVKKIDFKNIHNSPKYIKLLICILIILFILLIFYILFYASILKDIKEEKNKIQHMKNEYSSAIKLISKTKSIKNENVNIEKSLNVLLDKLPRNKETSSVIEDLNLIAKKNGLKVDSLIANNVNKSYGSNRLLKQVSYSLVITGSYNQILHFAYDISNMSRLFVLDNFNIDLLDTYNGSSTDNYLKLNAIVNTYQYEK